MNNPLDSIVFIQLPETADYEDKSFKIQTEIPLPLQKANASETFNPSSLSWDGILAGILTLLAYDPQNEHIDYYKDLLISLIRICKWFSNLFYTSIASFLFSAIQKCKVG